MGLSAIANDRNVNIFPVAMTVVKQENKDNWILFLEQFANDIGRPNDLNLVFISDKQKVLSYCSCLLLACDFILNAYMLTC